jgi:serine protease AprX
VGDRIGMYHPDVTAPGDAISSTCDTVGTLVGPCAPGSNAEAGGTSMASPHVAGAAAVLLQANPRLTIDQVRQALQATATPVFGSKKGSRLAFWEAGYGYVNLGPAVNLVRRPDYAKAIAKAQSAADKRVLASIGFTVRRSDFWAYDAPRVAIAGSDHRVFHVGVARAATHLKVALAHPSLGSLGANGMQYDVEVRDSAGRLLGTSTESDLGSGTSSLLVNLRAAKAKYGTFTIDVSGILAVSDPDTFDSDSLLGRMVTLQVAQLTTRR